MKDLRRAVFCCAAKPWSQPVGSALAMAALQSMLDACLAAQLILPVS
jgi:hypothetical protein